jgi:hypothetical protein
VGRSTDSEPSGNSEGRYHTALMFLKRKTHPDGSFVKCKARLVAGCDMHDKTLYEDRSLSPTVSTGAGAAIRGTRDLGVVLRPDAFGIVVRLFVDEP